MGEIRDQSFLDKLLLPTKVHIDTDMAFPEEGELGASELELLLNSPSYNRFGKTPKN